MVVWEGELRSPLWANEVAQSVAVESPAGGGGKGGEGKHDKPKGRLSLPPSPTHTHIPSIGALSLAQTRDSTHTHTQARLVRRLIGISVRRFACQPGVWRKVFRGKGGRRGEETKPPPNRAPRPPSRLSFRPRAARLRRARGLDCPAAPSADWRAAPVGPETGGRDFFSLPPSSVAGSLAPSAKPTTTRAHHRPPLVIFFPLQPKNNNSAPSPTNQPTKPTASPKANHVVRARPLRGHPARVQQGRRREAARHRQGGAHARAHGRGEALAGHAQRALRARAGRPHGAAGRADGGRGPQGYLPVGLAGGRRRQHG